MIDELAKLKRQVTRLKNQLAEADAERDLANMMALDLAPAAAISFIERKYPAIAKKWAKS